MLRLLIKFALIGTMLLASISPPVNTHVGFDHAGADLVDVDAELGHDALTEALDSLKEGGLIRKYSLVWIGRSEAPRIIVWKALDASDEELRRSVARSLVGLAAESQITVEKELK